MEIGMIDGDLDASAGKWYGEASTRRFSEEVRGEGVEGSRRPSLGDAVRGAGQTGSKANMMFAASFGFT